MIKEKGMRMTEQQLVDRIQEAIMVSLSFYCFVALLCILFGYLLVLADRYGYKLKYFRQRNVKKY